jgi:hypothetical protein
VNNLDANVTIISQVLHDIVDEFLLKENIKFNIKVFNKVSQFQLDILTDFMSKNRNKFSYNLTFNDLEEIESELLTRSNIIAIKSLEDILDITATYVVIRSSGQAIKYFILIPFLTFDQIKDSWICKATKKVTVHSGTFGFHSYYITNEEDTVTLSTIERFSPHGCNTPYLSKLNSFNKKSRRWTTKLINYEKFLNYHGCELVMMLPMPQGDGNYFFSGFSVVNANQTNFISIGISPAVFEISSKYYNFTPAFQPVIIEDNFFSSYLNQPIQPVLINGNI